VEELLDTVLLVNSVLVRWILLRLCDSLCACLEVFHALYTLRTLLTLLLEGIQWINLLVLVTILIFVLVIILTFFLSGIPVLGLFLDGFVLVISLCEYSKR